jgi:hypothetical protein
MITLAHFFPIPGTPSEEKEYQCSLGFSSFPQDIVQPSINCLQKRGMLHSRSIITLYMDTELGFFFFFLLIPHYDSQNENCL